MAEAALVITVVVFGEDVRFSEETLEGNVIFEVFCFFVGGRYGSRFLDDVF